MTRCKTCNNLVYMPFRCSACGESFCSVHHFPREHDCPGKIEKHASTVMPRPVGYRDDDDDDSSKDAAYWAMSSSIIGILSLLKKMFAVFMLLESLIAVIYTITLVTTFSLPLFIIASASSASFVASLYSIRRAVHGLEQGGMSSAQMNSFTVALLFFGSMHVFFTIALAFFVDPSVSILLWINAIVMAVIIVFLAISWRSIHAMMLRIENRGK